MGLVSQLAKTAEVIKKSSFMMLGLAAAMALSGLDAHASSSTNAAAAATQPIWLMGEVHDNPDGHGYRLRDLQAAVTADWRPAILMEQFNVDRQAELTQAWQTCKEAQCVIDAAGGKGWQWDLYKPVIQLALAYRLPLVAANVSREQLGQVMKQGFGAVFDEDTVKAYGLDKALPQEWLDGQRVAIREGHCNMLPEEMIDPMVNAQTARDVMFAKLMAEYAPQGVVLIAGNGHVRKDLGVYAWLPHELKSEVTVFGYVEPDGVSATWYDQVRVVPAHPRPDPCEAFKRSRS
ncbi:ChaN family lipoprotein [Orrella daihaiensis]|uniref:ChaN family lipoprotein n=1 Tax=Orrella daihaiensis TaxID=2782176 RepID=A0ABY4AKW8_9BURK|nr:ChaN family lipoprotein [Orrella daihaiensis]UOD50939.1 ChaN family lipoprotein [Orrella daihaiensis]